MALPCCMNRAPAGVRAARGNRVVARACQEAPPPTGPPTDRRRALFNMAASMVLAAVSPAAARAGEPFLTSTGGKGILAQEEQLLYNLRVEKEGEARREIAAEREKMEQEARASQIGKLCATPFGIDIVGITEFVALVGALVGGITARQRKAELERLNEQLRKINLGLRQQARAGTVYAPGLTYAPPTTPPAGGEAAPPTAAAAAAAGAASARPAATATITLPRSPAAAGGAGAAVPAPAAGAERTLLSLEEEEMSGDQIQCRDALRAGKRFLKEANGAAALVRFEKALMLSRALGDRVQERRATRGLAAAARLQGQFRVAISHLQRVLEISQAMGEYTGDADAYGTIADCYTDLDEFEKAAEFYDRYIQSMQK